MRQDRIAAVLILSSLAGTAAGTDYAEQGVVQLYAQTGQNTNEQFGYVTEQLVDYTGDGVPETLNSAPYRVVNGVPKSGAAFVHDGATGEIIVTHTGLVAHGFFGWRLALLGDINADGIRDYAVGAASDIYTTDPSVPGQVFVFSGSDHSTLRVLEAADYAVSDKDLGNDRFGQDVCPAGDVNGDGHDDLIVTADLWDEPGPNAGQAWLISGADFSVMRVHVGSATSERFGSSANFLGDVNGDGVGEYFICARNHDTNGSAWLYDGATGTEIFEFRGDSGGMRNFGQYFASSPGDTTGDGVPDIFVGDHEDVSNGGKTGAAYLFDVAAGLADPTSTLLPYWKVVGTRSQQWVGFGGGVGDVDHDGCADVATDFLFLPDLPEHRWSGRVRVYSGRTGKVLRTMTSTRGEGNRTGEQFGYSITPAGDANGDGEPDFVISAGFTIGASGSPTGGYYGIAGRRPCDADFDGDFQLNIDDIDTFVGMYLQSHAAADMDRSGLVDIDDIDVFVKAFLGGCA